MTLGNLEEKYLIKKDESADYRLSIYLLFYLLVVESPGEYRIYGDLVVLASALVPARHRIIVYLFTYFSIYLSLNPQENIEYMETWLYCRRL